MKTKPWFASKAVWAGIISVVGAGAGYMTGQLSTVVAVQSAVAALMGIFIRTGVGTPIE